MKYKVLETSYGPEIRFNDWTSGTARLIHAGGILQIFAEERAEVKWRYYPYGGGGDVSRSIYFRLRRRTENSEFIIHFTVGKHSTGFRLQYKNGILALFLRDKELYHRHHDTAMLREETNVKLITLAESFMILLNDEVLAQGNMQPPFTDNEGDTIFELQDIDVEITSFSEAFVIADCETSHWTRRELVHSERFGQTSFDNQWVCNGHPPLCSNNGYLFRSMSVNVLKTRFSGPLAIDITATPMPAPERFTAGVTDAIFVWMLDSHDRDLFEFMTDLEDASMSHYASLPLYWVDFGGTNNITTRMRKNPSRHLIRQFTDRARLLEQDRTYEITLVQNINTVEFWVNGIQWIAAYDPHPLTSGHVGCRAFRSDLRITKLAVWSIE